MKGVGGGGSDASPGETVERIVHVMRRLAALSGDLRRELAEPESEWAHETSSYDNHPADNATTVCDREMDVGLVQGLTRHLAEARRALEKWDAHTYGRCDRCGRAISSERLEARPESIWCLRCAEEPPHSTARPPEEDVVQAPDGTLYGRDPVEDTGRDFLAAVMQWGSSDRIDDTPPAVDADDRFVGLADRQNSVEPIERYIDSQGDVLWDAVRRERRERWLSTEGQDDREADTPPVGSPEGTGDDGPPHEGRV